jgi:hypothetical protein
MEGTFENKQKINENESAGKADASLGKSLPIDT